MSTAIISKLRASIYTFLATALLFQVNTIASAQNLLIDNSGQTGTSGTNWSTSGTNPVTITFVGSSNINISVIEGYLNNGVSVLVTANPGGGNITLAGTGINKTLGGDATLTLRARNSVYTNSIISTSGKLNTILWVEHDGDQALGPAVGTITTNGGHIWVGGGSGSSIWNGLTVGNSVAYSNGSANANPIDLIGDLTTSGGDVLIATDGTENTGSFGDIAAWNAARTINTGSGDISLLTELADFTSSQGHAITLITSGTLTIAPPNSSKKWPSTFTWQGTLSGSTFTGQSSNASGLIINNYSSLTAISIGTYLGTGVPGDNAYTPVTNTEVKDIQINSAITASKAINIYGLSVYVSANLTTTHATDGDLYIKCAADIIQGINDTVRTNGADVVYWADFDANGGRIEVLSNISTNGGNIWIGGGISSETQNGLLVPTGYAESVSMDKQGVLIKGSNINSSGGTIRVKGLSDDSGNGTKDIGTMIVNSTINSGAGNLSIYGTINNDLSQGGGLWIGTEIGNSSTSTGNVTINTTSGNIYLEGIAAPNNTYTWCHGLMFYAAVGDDISINSTTGAISFNGNGVTAAGYSGEAVGLVMQMNNTSSTFNVNTDGGAISLTGNGGNSGDDYGLGIRANDIVNSIKIGDPNTGKINFSFSSLQTNAQTTLGVVSIETSDSVLFEPISTSFGAAVSLTDEYTFASTIKRIGIGKTGNTANVTINCPMNIAGPITAEGGTITINANITSATTSGIGISLNGQKIDHAAGVSVITSGSNIEYLVTNSPWTAAADIAVALNSASGTQSTINAQGGNITINASFATTGTNNSGSNQEFGIMVSNTDIITSGSGTISINGDIYNNNSSTGQFSWGVDLRSGTVIRTASGAINISGRGGKSLSNSRGVVSNTTNLQVLSSSGAITFIDSLPSGNANYTGMYFRSSSANAIKFGADGSTVASSSSDINFISDRITFETDDIQITSTGKVFILPEGTSFGTTLSYTKLNLSSTVSELLIGKRGNTSTISLNRATSIAGPITAYGGTVNINNNITSTLAGAAISLYSNNDIDPNPATTCTLTTNNGNITVVADADSSGGGNFYLGGTGVFSINSGSGNILLRTEAFSETGLSITSTGTLTIEPSDASFAVGGFTTSWINFPSTITGLTIGKITNTNAVNVGAGVSVNGPIAIYATTINLNATSGLTSTAISATISLYGKENIDGNAIQTISTNNGNVTIVADADSSGTGTLWLDAISIAPGSGNTLARGEAISFSSSSINGSGTVTIESSDASFGTGGIANNGLTLDSTITGLTIGKTTNVNNVTLGSATTIAGPITAYGGNISITSNNTSTASEADLLFKSVNNITVDENRTIQTNNGDITFWANADGTANATDGDFIGLNSGVTINSANGSTNQNSGGGTITFAGGNTSTTLPSGTVVPDDYAFSNRTTNWGHVPPAGVSFGSATASSGKSNAISIYSGGGNIIIKGKAANSSPGYAWFAGASGSTQVINSGIGTITIDGISISNGHGIELTYYSTAGNISPTITSSNTSASAISVTAQTSATGSLAGYQGRATFIANGTNGGIFISGKTASTNNYGAMESSALNAYALNGTITLVGDGGAGLKIGGTWGQGTLASSSSNIILRSDKLSLYSSTPQTTGTVTVESFNNSFSSAITFPITNLTVANTVTGLTIGKATNTSNVTFNSATSISGPINIYGGDIAIAQNINTSAGGAAGDVLVKGTGDVVLANSKNITTTAGDVTLWADSDNDADGYIQTGTSTSISTSGGAITMGGGTNITTGFARGTNILDRVTEPTYDLYISGVHLMNGTNLSSGGGNITLRGQNFNGTASVMSFGVMGANTTVDAGTGKVSITGKASGSGTLNAQGLSGYLSNWTIRSANTTADAIYLEGDATACTSSATSLGTNIAGVIEATGIGGGITIIGKAGTATNYDDGLNVTGDVLAVSGPITFIGENNNTAQRYGLFSSNTTIGFKAGTNVTSSSSNIVIKGDQVTYNANTNINTTGTVSLLPNDASNSFGATQTLGSSPILNSNISGLTIGKSTNTANIILGTTTTIAGPITVYGGNIQLGTGVELTSTSANGNITLQASNGFNTAASTGTTRGRILTYGGNIHINADSDDNNSGELDIDWLTFDANAGDILLEAATYNWSTASGVTMPEFYGTGALTIRTVSSGSYGFNSDWIALFQVKKELNFGREGNTAAININPCTPCNSTALNYTGKSLSVAGPISLRGGNVSIATNLTATNSNITIEANTTLTQTQPITANGLSLSGAGTFTLNNTSNNIATIAAGTNAAKIGNLSVIDTSGGLIIGNVNTPGIYSTGTISIQTLSGDITITENLSTTNTTASALKLFADKNKTAGDGTGGNILVSGNGGINVGTGGTGMLYAGKYGLSTGLQNLLTSSNIRYNVDATTSSFSPSIGTGIYGLFREGIFVWNGTSSTNHTSGANWQGNSAPPEGSYIQISPTATNNLQLNDNWSVGTIELPAGKVIDLNGYSLTVTGELVGNGKFKGSPTSSLTISGGGNFGTLYMDQTTNGSTNALQNFTFNRANQTVTIADTLVITHDGTVTPTAGTIATGNKLKLLSNLSGTGRIAQLGTNADITGDVTLQRYIVGNNSIMRGWRMMSIPTTSNAYTQLNDDILVSGPGGVSSGFDIAGPTSSIRTWQESATRGWTSISNINNTLTAGKGALVFFRGDRTQTASLTNTSIVPNNVTADYVGPINKGNIAVNLDFANDSTPIYGKGFNLLGNPYPSQIDWENLSKTAQIDNYFWVWNPVTKGYVGNATGTISSGQAFFVRATQTAQSVTFEENDKTATSTTAYFKNNQGLIVKMNLDSVQYDIAWLKFLNGASKNYVFKEDGLKLANSGYNLSFIANNNVSVQHNIVDFLAPNQSDTFVMQVNSVTNSAYNFSFDNISQIPLNKMVFLKDLYNNSWTDLRANNNYAYTINNNLSNTYGNRFLLIITDVYNPLPIHITAFKGERKQHINQLNWNVAQEKNIAYYQVQRSVDGNDFNDIGIVKAQNSSTAQLYVFNDENATDLDVAYYRLKVMEQNGEFNYSSTIVIHNIKQLATSINVYPIPTQDWINIETDEAVLSVKIYDIRGKLIQEASAANKIDISQLQTGVYIMKVETSSGISTHKIIKE